MRRLLRIFLPIFSIALMVQLFAPIGACMSAAIAASDPFRTVEICHEAPRIASDAGQQDDQTGRHGEYGGACIICCLASANAAIDTPQIEAIAVFHRQTARVVWLEQVAGFSGACADSNPRARAPPSIS